MNEAQMPGWKSTAMFQSNPHFLKKIYKNIDDLKEFLKPDDELLDVGCGHGHLCPRLGHEKYTGIDLFPENISEAKRLHPAGKFEVGDLFELKGQWDVVFCSRVLIHIPNFEQAVKTLRACAKKYCLVTLPIGGDVCDLGRDGAYFRTFSEATIGATNPIEIRAHDLYSTIIYGPLLP
jgi:SAM-dependent methyltransferase